MANGFRRQDRLLSKTKEMTRCTRTLLLGSTTLYLFLIICAINELLQSSAVHGPRCRGFSLAHIHSLLPYPPHWEGLPSRPPQCRLTSRTPQGRSCCGATLRDAREHLERRYTPSRGHLMFVGSRGPRRFRAVRDEVSRKMNTRSVAGAAGPSGTPTEGPSEGSRGPQRSAATAMRLEVLRTAKEGEEMRSAFPVALRVPHPELVAGKVHALRSDVVEEEYDDARLVSLGLHRDDVSPSWWTTPSIAGAAEAPTTTAPASTTAATAAAAAAG